MRLNLTAPFAAAFVGSMVLWVAPAAAQRLQYCATESGYCEVPYPTTVVYGVPGAQTSRRAGPDGIPCNNRVFGDPAPGAKKACWFVRRGYDGYDGYDRPRRRYY